jgi:hypothetical protein
MSKFKPAIDAAAPAEGHSAVSPTGSRRAGNIRVHPWLKIRAPLKFENSNVFRNFAAIREIRVKAFPQKICVHPWLKIPIDRISFSYSHLTSML